MSHEPYLEMASGYALGVLDGEDRSRFEAHLEQGCRECEAVLREYGETLAALTAELPPASPPPSVKAALMARIEAQSRPVRPAEAAPPWWSLWRMAWAGAAVAAAVVAGYLGLKVNALNRELAQRAEEIAKLQNQVAEQREHLAILRAPETQVVVLAGLKPSPAAQGRMWWHREAGGVFVVSGLPAVPSGKTYQLWAIAAGKPVSGGIFDVDPDGRGTFRVRPIPGVEKVELFAVTLEPAGGLPQPSGDMYLSGKLL